MSSKSDVFKETDPNLIIIKLRRFADRYSNFDEFLKVLMRYKVTMQYLCDHF